MKLDRIAKYKGFGSAREQGIDSFYQCGLRTPVCLQVIALDRRQLTRLHISEYIAAAKAVNRLLRIADQGQAEVLGEFVTRLIDMTEDAILNTVGVLKFVDHGNRILLAQVPGQGDATF